MAGARAPATFYQLESPISAKARKRDPQIIKKMLSLNNEAKKKYGR
jgi:hypothetical protein